MSKYKFIGTEQDLLSNGFEFMIGFTIKRYELKSLFNKGMSMTVLMEDRTLMFNYIARANLRTIEELEQDKNNYIEQIKFVKAKLRYLIDRGLVVKV